MTPRLAAVALALALPLIAPSCGSTTSHVGPPSANKVPKGTCNPGRRHYCFNDRYAAQARAALSWAADHPNAEDRKPAHFPLENGLARTATPAHYVVYIVTFKPAGGGPRLVWKYGQTQQQPWHRRSQDGVRRCERNAISATGSCSDEWIAVTEATYGYYRALYLEAALVRQWNEVHGGAKTGPGRCPPGQEESCR